jgi:hypothetical protein
VARTAASKHVFGRFINGAPSFRACTTGRTSDDYGVRGGGWQARRPATGRGLEGASMPCPNCIDGNCSGRCITAEALPNKKDKKDKKKDKKKRKHKKDKKKRKKKGRGKKHKKE